MRPLDTGGKEIKSTETAFDIIETVAARDRPTISEIAAAVDHSRSTVHYHLKTLQRNRYVVRDENGLRLGLRIARLGSMTLDQHALSGIVEHPTDKLAAEAETTAHVAIREATAIVWFYTSSDGGPEEVCSDIGTETPLHCTAYGQAILASLPTETVEDLVKVGGLSTRTEHTLTDPEALFDRLATVRELGFAYTAEEYVSGLGSIAAPIVDESTGKTTGAVGITDHNNRFDDPYKHPKARRFSNELPGLVKRASQIIGNEVTDK